MKLSFPNPCRSFDADKNRISFWGYASSIEVSFFIEADALKCLCPEMSDVESGFLLAFDAERERIHEVADKVYRRGSE
jgi:hypothetical protein